MQVRLSAWSVCLILVACGRHADAGADPAATAADAAESTEDEEPGADAAPVELDDALMEQYVAISREMKTAGDKGLLGLLATRGWSMERWVNIAGAVTQGMVTASLAQVGDAAAAASADYDRQLQDAEAKLKTAGDSEREGLQLQIDALKAAKAQMAGMQAGVSDVGRRNAAVLERWRPRLEALDQQK